MNYGDCLNCGLIFLLPEFHLSPQEEKPRYLLHENCLQQPGYRQHLLRFWAPLNVHLQPGQSGLDYGSGPSPELSSLVSESGFQHKIWDPFFANFPENLQGTYDFVTCLEVIEHCILVGKDLQRMLNLLVAGGYLGIGTLIWDDQRDFSQWGYRLDPTHVVFFRRKTIKWVANHWGLDLIYISTHVFIYKLVGK